MSKPIVDSATPTPATVVPGGTLKVKVVAHDPDSKPYTLPGTVQDAAGNIAPWTVVVAVADPLTYVADPVTGWTVASDPADPTGATFIYTAP